MPVMLSLLGLGSRLRCDQPINEEDELHGKLDRKYSRAWGRATGRDGLTRPRILGDNAGSMQKFCG
jgi:hypothetical protein